MPGPPSTTGRERDAAREAWQCAIDACFEHDCEHARRATADLVSLGELVPAPRADPDSTPS